MGYAAGLVLSEYVRLGDLRPALKSAFGGMVGWGISTVFEFVGGLAMILLVVTQVPR